MRFTGAGPDHIVVARCHGNGAHRQHGLLIEDRGPVHAGVGGLVNAAGGGADIVRGRVARDAGRGTESVPFGANMAPRERGVRRRSDNRSWGGWISGLGRRTLGAGHAACGDSRSDGERRGNTGAEETHEDLRRGT